MALNVTLHKHGGKAPSSPLIPLVVNVDFDDSYPTGGEAFDPGAFLKSLGKYDQEPEILAVIPISQAGYVFEYDYTNKKLLAYHADYDAMADGPLVEVPDMTDLAALLDVKVLILAQ